MVLVIDVTECFIGLVFTTLVSLTTIYGYNYYQSYQRQEYFKKILSQFWNFFYKSTNLSTQIKQTNILSNILSVATTISQNTNSFEKNGKFNFDTTLNELLTNPQTLNQINTLINLVTQNENSHECNLDQSKEYSDKVNLSPLHT